MCADKRKEEPLYRKKNYPDRFPGYERQKPFCNFHLICYNRLFHKFHHNNPMTFDGSFQRPAGLAYIFMPP